MSRWRTEGVKDSGLTLRKCLRGKYTAGNGSGRTTMSRWWTGGAKDSGSLDLCGLEGVE